MAIKKWVFKKLNEDAKEFTHYWDNDGDNFPDVTDIQDYLDEYYPKPDYDWVEAEDLRLERNTNGTLKIEIPSEALENNRCIFIRIKDDEANELYQYYYGNNFNQVSDENYSTISYSVVCDLDCWSTFGCKMHKIMKNTTEPILFKNMFVDRFIRDKSGEGYYVDYLKQPWLMRLVGQQSLIRDETEASLTMSDWLYINSGYCDTYNQEYWLENYWFPWYNNQFFSHIKIGSKQRSSGVVASDSLPGIYQLDNAIKTNKTTINDSAYNSNGKYKWLVTRTGNNTVIDKLANKGAMFPKDPTLLLYTQCYENPSITLSPEINSGTLIKQNKTYYYIYKEVDKVSIDVTSVNDLIISFTKNLLNKDYIKLNIAGKTVYITDKLDSVLKPWLVKYPLEFTQTIVEFNNVKTYIPSLSKVISFTPRLKYLFNVENGKIVRYYFSLSVEFDEELDITVKLPEDIHFNEINWYKPNSTKERTIGDATPIKFNGEQLALFPIKKGIEGQQEILDLNNSTEVMILGSAMTLGMPVNDIPPEILGLSVRRFSDESEYQTFGDLISVRKITDSGTSLYNPTDIAMLDFWDSYKEEGSEKEKSRYDWMYPAIFTTLDYIPITLAVSPTYNQFYYVVGGTNFLNEFYRLMCDKDKLISTKNTMDNDPAMFNPMLFQWVYYIDGQNKLRITPDMIDFKKFMTEDWSINLNLNMTTATAYRLDLGKLKHPLYPFTKSFVELTSTDITSHPYGTEAYNNFYQGNQLTQETSKNAKDIDIKWSKENWKWSIPDNLIGNAGGGLAAGAAAGAVAGPIGALIGGIAGGITGLFAGGAKVGTSYVGLQNSIKQVNEQWNNDWNGYLGNMYSAPSSLNPSGFTSGSLIYSDVSAAKTDEYALLRTFKLIDIDRRKIWYDVSTNGYPVMSEFMYNQYDNRKNFNIVNCNPSNKSFFFINALKKEMKNNSTIFSQDEYIAWFLMKTTKKLRLFKKDLEVNNINDLIEGNVENEELVPYRLSNAYVVYDNVEQFPIVSETKLDKQTHPYTQDKTITDKTVMTKNNLKHTELYIYYYDLDKNCETLEEFKKVYSSLGLNNSGSSIKIHCPEIEWDYLNNTLLSTFDLLSNIDITTATIGSTQTDTRTLPIFNDEKALSYVYINNDTSLTSTAHNVGFKITILFEDKKMKFDIDEIDNYEFGSYKEVTSMTFYGESGAVEFDTGGGVRISGFPNKLLWDTQDRWSSGKTIDKKWCNWSWSNCTSDSHDKVWPGSWDNWMTNDRSGPFITTYKDMLSKIRDNITSKSDLRIQDDITILRIPAILFKPESFKNIKGSFKIKLSYDVYNSAGSKIKGPGTWIKMENEDEVSYTITLREFFGQKIPLISLDKRYICSDGIDFRDIWSHNEEGYATEWYCCRTDSAGVETYIKNVNFKYDKNTDEYVLSLSIVSYGYLWMQNRVDVWVESRRHEKQCWSVFSPQFDPEVADWKTMKTEVLSCTIPSSIANYGTYSLSFNQTTNLIDNSLIFVKNPELWLPNKEENNK